MNNLGFDTVFLILVTCLGLFGPQLKVLRPFQSQMLLRFAHLTFHTENYLTRGLGFLVEDRLGLSPKTHLLRVVTTLPLSKVGGLARLILGHLHYLVLPAFLASAKSFAFLGYVNHLSACVHKA